MSPRRVAPDLWPWRADTPTERVRRALWAYRDELLAVAPDRARELDRKMSEWGQPWVVRQLAVYTDDDQLTIDEVADFCGVKVTTVDQWRRRGLVSIDTPDGRRFVMRDLLEYHATKRRRRSPHWKNGLTVLP